MTAVARMNPLQADIINRRARDYSATAKGWALSSLLPHVSEGARQFVAPVLQTAQGFQSSVRTQALALITELEVALSQFDLRDLPAFSTRCADDGSATIEMRFPDVRLAFTLESDPKESGWHVVSSKSAGGWQAHGDLPSTSSEVGRILALATRHHPGM